MSILNVDLGKRSYPIHIQPGLLEDGLSEALNKHVPAEKYIIIADETVAGLYQTHLSDLPLFTVPAGESSKSFGTYQKLCEDILSTGIDRQTVIVAFGGGVIGDLAGFVASTLMRSIPYVQIPTTLLAMVDSSVGGKTGIDTPQGKNLIGTFHQPQAVLIDPDVLKTLPARHLKAGYAEVVKYGLIQDENFYDWLTQHGSSLVKGEIDAQIKAIETSCQAKANVVAADETEQGQRALLNLGHTFGHAIEKINGYNESILHGEAVAIGIVLAFKLSHRLGLCSTEDITTITQHLNTIDLPTRLSDFKHLPTDPQLYLAAMTTDKKALNGWPAFILVRGIGKAFISTDVTQEDVRPVLAEG